MCCNRRIGAMWRRFRLRLLARQMGATTVPAGAHAARTRESASTCTPRVCFRGRSSSPARDAHGHIPRKQHPDRRSSLHPRQHSLVPRPPEIHLHPRLRPWLGAQQPPAPLLTALYPGALAPGKSYGSAGGMLPRGSHRKRNPDSSRLLWKDHLRRTDSISLPLPCRNIF